MVLINNLTIDEINAALLHLQRSQGEIVGGNKGNTINNISVTQQGGGGYSPDFSSAIKNLEKRVDTLDVKIEQNQQNIAGQSKINVTQKDQISDLYNLVNNLRSSQIVELFFDEDTRVLTLATTDTRYDVPLPSEEVSLTFDSLSNKLVFTMGEQTQEVTLPYINANEKGVANGVATLDATGRVPYSQLPESAMEFKGEWNADTNTPELKDGHGTNGDFYICSQGGTVNFGTSQSPRNITFYVNDRVIYQGNAAQWKRLPASEVRTVNGQSGDVVLNGTNVNYSNADNSPTLKDKIDSVETKAETQSNWTQSDTSAIDYIKNKPNLATVATSGSYNDLSNKPTIPAAQIQSDWTQTDSTKKDFIKHKIPIWITSGIADDNMSPIDSVTDGNMRPVTSNAVYQRLRRFAGYYKFSPDYTRYILMADITTWYNSTSSSQTQNVTFAGILVRYRTSGLQANSTCIINLSVGYYRNNAQLPNNNYMNVAKTETSQSTVYSLCIINYQGKIYLAIRLNTVLAGENYFYGLASQNPLLTLVSNSETVTEIYVVP